MASAKQIKQQKAFAKKYAKKGKKKTGAKSKKSKSNPKKKKSTNVKRLEDRISELERQLTKLADIQSGGMGYAGTEYHEVLTRMKKSEHAERKQELSDELKKEMKY
jgi:type VI protein secretion system component VasK